jgi:hypothetical protein
VLFLLASVAATAAGPLIFPRLKRSHGWLARLDSFLLVSLAGLVVVVVLPHAISEAGPAVLLAALAGGLGPIWFERRHARGHHPGVASVALLALGLHMFLDGAALTSDHAADEGASLAVAVILHRFPVGMAIGARLPSRLAWPVLVAVVTFTACGYFVGDAALPHLSPTMVAWFDALMGGLVLHVALEPDVHCGANHASPVGLALGGAGVAVLAWNHLGPLPLWLQVASPAALAAIVAWRIFRLEGRHDTIH